MRVPEWFCENETSVKIDFLFCEVINDIEDWIVDLVQAPGESCNGKHTVSYKHKETKKIISCSLGKEEGTLNMSYGVMKAALPKNYIGFTCYHCGGGHRGKDCSWAY